jgi:hypothetical protein
MLQIHGGAFKSLVVIWIIPNGNQAIVTDGS